MQELKNRFSIYSDEELMCYLSQGEVQAFDELYGRYSRRLLLYFVRMLNFDRGLAEDALQDLFLKVAEHPEKFDRSRSFKTWIFSVASNTCKNYYRHKKVVEKSHEALIYLNTNPGESSFSKVAGKLDDGEFRRTLEEVLDELSPEKKEAFLLKYQEDKSIAEIAFIQNCPPGSVKSRLHYTIRLLEERLAEFNPVIH